MSHKIIKQLNDELVEILKTENAEKKKKLLDLAKKIGANRYHWARVGGDNDATEAQLVDGIHQALQTKTMVEMCKIANRNVIVAIIATSIAFISALAVWVPHSRCSGLKVFQNDDSSSVNCCEATGACHPE